MKLSCFVFFPQSSYILLQPYFYGFFDWFLSHQHVDIKYEATPPQKMINDYQNSLQPRNLRMMVVPQAKML